MKSEMVNLEIIKANTPATLETDLRWQFGYRPQNSQPLLTLPCSFD